MVAIQQNIVMVPLYAVHIQLWHRFPVYHLRQPHINGGQTAVSRNKVKALKVVHNLQAIAGHRPATTSFITLVGIWDVS